MNLPNPALMQRYGTSGIFLEKVAGASPFAARVAATLFAGTMAHAAGTEMDRQRAEAHQLNEQFRLVEQRIMGPIDQSLQHAQAPRFVQAGSDLPVGWDEGMVRLAAIARGAGEDLAKLADGMLQRPMVQSDPFKLHHPLPSAAAAPKTNYLAGMPGPQGAPAPRAAAPAPAQAPSTTGRASPGVLAGPAGPKLQAPPINRFTAPVSSHAPAPPPALAAAASVAGKGSLGAPTSAAPGMAESLLGKGWKGKAFGAGALLGGGYLALKGLNAGLGALSRPAPAQQNWGAPGTQLPMGVNQYGQPQLGSPLMG